MTFFWGGEGGPSSYYLCVNDNFRVIHPYISAGTLVSMCMKDIFLKPDFFIVGILKICKQ